MPDEKDLKIWKQNGERYLFLLRILEKRYEQGNIEKRKKKKIEKILFSMWEKTHEELNPFTKENPLLREMSISFLKNSNLIYVFHI